MTKALRLLFVASEAFPLVKTGGLADVAGSLPEVLRQQGVDTRLLLPAYADVLEKVTEPLDFLASFSLAGEQVQLLQVTLPGTELVTWLLSHPRFSERPGNPYHDGQGLPWPDNAERFLLLSRAAAALALGQTPVSWQPDVLHCNDWHTGPAVALTHLANPRPLTVFTIHNLAHLGMFDRATFDRLQLPERFWQDDSLEFFGQCCFMKGGLAYADYITTVSPTYAREICEAPGGMGLEGLLSHRQQHLVGILNGIDNNTWNPSSDPLLAHNYDLDSLDGKAQNKSALQAQTGLEVRNDRPLLGFVGRLAEQKGLELMLPVLEEVIAAPAQLVFLGTGDTAYEQQLQELAARHPGSMAVTLGYNESLAHRIEAGADLFLMPSLFEPCGLNQLYSLRYGTLPVVRWVGGLADTVIDATDENIENGSASGFVFVEPEPMAFLEAVRRGIALYDDRTRWRQIQVAAMSRDFSWQQSAARYLELYRANQEQDK